MSLATTLHAQSISIRDFAYPAENPLYYGIENYEAYIRHEEGVTELPEEEDTEQQHCSLSDPLGVHGRAVALYDFEPENDNEVALREGQEIWISYKHGQGWLVAEDLQTGENGLVPEEYVQLLSDEEWEDLSESGELIADSNEAVSPVVSATAPPEEPETL